MARFLLLQARDEGDPMLAQERQCFASRLRLPVEEIEPHNLVAGPPRLAEARRHAAVLVGGSGDYLVSRGNLPRFADTLEFLRRLVDSDHPTFASCFGFQCLVEALGGRIVYDPQRAEVGTFEVTLTAAGRDDELLGALPERFAAQQGHKDRAAELPPGTIHLASSRLSPYQAFRLRDHRIWATQFHPELDRRTNEERYQRYLEHYRGQVDFGGEGRVAGFGDSPESEALLRAFARRYAP